MCFSLFLMSEKNGENYVLHLSIFNRHENIIKEAHPKEMGGINKKHLYHMLLLLEKLWHVS